MKLGTAIARVLAQVVPRRVSVGLAVSETAVAIAASQSGRLVYEEFFEIAAGEELEAQLVKHLGAVPLSARRARRVTVGVGPARAGIRIVRGLPATESRLRLAEMVRAAVASLSARWSTTDRVSASAQADGSVCAFWLSGELALQLEAVCAQVGLGAPVFLPAGLVLAAASADGRGTIDDGVARLSVECLGAEQGVRARLHRINPSSTPPSDWTPALQPKQWAPEVARACAVSAPALGLAVVGRRPQAASRLAPSTRRALGVAALVALCLVGIGGPPAFLAWWAHATEAESTMLAEQYLPVRAASDSAERVDRFREAVEARRTVVVSDLLDRVGFSLPPELEIEEIETDTLGGTVTVVGPTPQILLSALGEIDGLAEIRPAGSMVPVAGPSDETMRLTVSFVFAVRGSRVQRAR